MSMFKEAADIGSCWWHAGGPVRLDTQPWPSFLTMSELLGSQTFVWHRICRLVDDRQLV